MRKGHNIYSPLHDMLMPVAQFIMEHSYEATQNDSLL